MSFPFNRKAVKTATIIDQNIGKRITLRLIRDGECYAWFAGEESCELSAPTVSGAVVAAKHAWANPKWELEIR